MTAIVVSGAEYLRRRRRYVRAGFSEDERTLRAAFDRYRETYEGVGYPRTRAHLSLHEAGVLAREHSWNEAAAMLDGLSAEHLHPEERGRHLLLRASTLAHLGDPARAHVGTAAGLARNEAQRQAVGDGGWQRRAREALAAMQRRSGPFR